MQSVIGMGEDVLERSPVLVTACSGAMIGMSKANGIMNSWPPSSLPSSPSGSGSSGAVSAIVSDCANEIAKKGGEAIGEESIEQSTEGPSCMHAEFLTAVFRRW